ncbi:MAG: hypothetical protein ACR2KV_13835 [Solirubrobacteraceae bacterium]
MCAVCGRSLLRGEHANVFIAGGARRDVCELCTTRAAHEGWIRDGADAAPAPRPRGGERARSLVGRLRSRIEAASPAADQDVELPEPVGRPAPSEQREIHAVPTNAELKVSRALELFNRSTHTKTVSGVARSLGSPDVSVAARADDGALVEIVVAWELCWYRYEVDLADEPHAVRLLGQGYELEELGDEPRAANAVADGRGELALGVA